MTSNRSTGDGGRHNKNRTILIVLASLFGVFLLMCGGLVALIAVAINQSTIGIDEQLRANRDITNLIGEIQSVAVDNVATAKKQGADTWVYTVQGTRGKGVLVFTKRVTSTGHEQIENGTFYLDKEGSDTTVDLKY